MPQLNFDREEGILSVIIFAFFAVVTQNLGISIAVTIAAIYTVTMWFPNGAAGLLAQATINRTMAQSDMTPQKLQEKFTALSSKECRYFVSLKTPEEKVSELNDTAQRAIEAKVAGLIPTLEGNPKRDAPEVLNIVLLGKIGSGKSETGNLILGKKGAFKVSDSSTSVTQTIKVEECTIDGMRIRVCDTPGSIDINRPEVAISAELLKIGVEFKEGIHLFVFLKNMANTRFTPEETKAFEVIKEAFSEKALDHCIFLMSFADTILGHDEHKDRTIRGYLEHVEEKDKEIDAKGNESVQAIYESVGHRVIAVENHPETVYEREVQRRSLIEYFKSTIEMAKNEAFHMEAVKKANEKLKELLDPYDEDVKEAVWAYLREKTYEELENLVQSEPAVRRALCEIVAKSPFLMGKENVISKALKATADVLVSTSKQAIIAGLAIALFAAAGAIIGGPPLAVGAGATATAVGVIHFARKTYNYIFAK